MDLFLISASKEAAEQIRRDVNIGIREAEFSGRANGR